MKFWCREEYSPTREDCRECICPASAGHEGWDCCRVHCTQCKNTSNAREARFILKKKKKASAPKPPAAKVKPGVSKQSLFRNDSRT